MKGVRLLLCAASLALAGFVRADDVPGEADRRAPTLLQVPADDPSFWPPGAWKPVSRPALDAYLSAISLPSAAQTSPPPRPLEATYQGELNRDMLRGRVQLRVGEGGKTPGEIVLAPLGVRLTNLRWSTQPAIWGTRADGRTIVAPAAGEDTLSAEWELPGRRVFDSLEFNIEVPFAGATRLMLDLPVDLEVTTSAAVVRRGTMRADRALQTWVLEAGRRTNLLLSIQPAAKDVQRPVALAKLSHFATLQGEGIDLLTDVEVVSGSIADLQFVIPSDLQVISATLGAEQPVPFRVRIRNARSELTLTPAAAGVRDARLRIRGFLPVEWETPQPLPIPRLADGFAVDEHLTVHVRPPLLLQSIDPDGFRLTDRRIDADEYESWVFEALRRDATLSARVVTEPPELAYDLMTWADYRSTTARLRSRLLVTGGGGPTFDLSVLCPDEWEVIDVRPFRGDAATVIASYHSEPATSDSQRLLIELRQPLESGQELDLIVEAVAAAPARSQTLSLPAPVPERAANYAGLLAILPPKDAEVSSVLPLLSSSDAEKRLERLQEMSPQEPLSQALVFELPQQVQESRLAGISFDPMTPLRDPLADGAEPGSVPAGGASGLGQSHAFARLRLTTMLAGAGGRHHRHAAEYLLQQEFTGPCEFRASDECNQVRLSVDGERVDLLRSGDKYVTTTAVTARRSLRIDYRSLAEDFRLTAEEAVPLPSWNSPPPPLEWLVVPAETRACFRASLPFGRIVQRGTASWLVRMFGPLASEQAMATVSPEPAPDASRWSAPGLSAAEAAVAGPGRRWGILHMESPQTPERISIQVWDPRFTDRLAWSVLMLAGAIGSLLRRRRSLLARRVAPAVFVILAGIAGFAPGPMARVAGAALSGALLAVLLPRGMVTARRFSPAARSSRDKPSGARVSVPAGAALFAVVLAADGWTQEPANLGAPAVPIPSTPPDGLLPERDGERAPVAYLSPEWAARLQTWLETQPASSSWLIRSADYRVQIDEQSTVTATYEILTRGPEQTAVRLALDRVTFSDSDSVTIDGKPGAVIPASQGGGLYVQVGEASTDSGDASTDSAESQPVSDEEWITHRVEIRCRTAVSAIGNRRVVSFQIPSVASSRLSVIASESILSRLVFQGRRFERSPDQPEAASISLGSAAQAAFEWTVDDSEAPQTALPPLVATHVDVYPLRHDFRAFVWLPADPENGSSTWSFPLTEGVELQRVEAPANVRWRTVTQGVQRSVEFIADSPITDPALVTLHAVRPVDASSDPSGTVSLLPALSLSGPNASWMAVRPPAGFALMVFENGAAAPGATSRPDALPLLAWEKLNQSGGVIHQAERGRKRVRLEPQQTVREASVDSRLTVRRSQADWQAEIRLDVTGAATPVHRLKIPPRVMLDRAMALQDGADRLSRFTRRGDTVELVLSRPYSGTIDLQLSGHVEILGREPLKVPHIEFVDAATLSSACRISNQSGWPVELEKLQSGRVILQPSAEGAPAAELTFSAIDPDRPVALRLLPGPDAAMADLVTQFARDARGEWLQRNTILVQPVGMALSEVQVSIPESMRDGLRISPAADVRDRSVHEGGAEVVTFLPARLRGGVYRIQLQSPLKLPTSDSLWEYVAPTVLTARRGQRLVMLDAALPYRPTSATGAVLDWADVPRRWRSLRRNDSVIAAEIHAEGDIWTWSSVADRGAETAVPLVESIVWSDPDSGTRGATLLTVVSAGRDRITFQLPAGVVIDRATLDGEPAEVELRDTSAVVRLPADAAAGCLKLRWRGPSADRGGRLPLPRPDGWRPDYHVAAFLPSTSDHRRLANRSAPLAVACRRMAGLVMAAAQQSTRSFPLDSPLLESLRRADSQLEELMSSKPLGQTEMAECRALRARWKQIHELIAVQSAPPGEADAQGPRAPAPTWDHVGANAGLDTAVVPDGVWELSTISDGAVMERAAASACLAALFALLVLLQRTGTIAALSDWLAAHPGAACLLLGGLWIALLQPRIVGVLLVFAGVTLLSRDRSREPRGADSALVGPGR